jgi:CheY-like chemotaxis protein
MPLTPRTFPGKAPLVLVIDDNEDNLDLAVQTLSYSGYRVVTAEDGDAGTVLALKETPDAVIMDLEMPKLDGWQATRVLKSIPSLRHVPVICMTAHVTESERQRAARPDAISSCPSRSRRKPWCRPWTPRSRPPAACGAKRRPSPVGPSACSAP